MLNSFSLKKRFWLSFCLFWLVIILCTIVGVVGLVSARDSLRLVHQDKMETVNLLHDLTENFQDTRSHIFRAFQHNPASDLHLLHNHDVIDHINAIGANQQKNKTLRDQLANRTVDVDESVLREAVFTALNNWRVKLDLVTKGIAVENYSNDLMFLFLTAGREEGVEVEKSLRSLANYQNSQADIAATAAEKRYKDSVILLILLYVLLAGPASVFMMLSLRRLSHGLASVEYAADAIAKGDLTHEIFLSGNDEMTQVNSKIIIMQENLTQLISGIRSSTYDIEAGISFLAESSAGLGDRNSQQAASLEQTSAATEQLNGTVELNADNARQAERNAEEANAVAIRGGQVVQGVVRTMGKINDSSVHIAEIVSIIDSIAFQTNILALNAAVEAARAGEQGRGFAVVASEVRALAQRSASAASEIKELVEESINVVTEGSSQVKNAGDTMQDIVNSNAKLAALIREISSASQEQVIGLSQINQAILLMDTATHQNNELASSTSDTTTQLHNQAEHLLELVSAFRLKPVHQASKKLNNLLI